MKMMNEFTMKVWAVLLAAMMVIAFSVTSTVVVEAREVMDAYTVSTSEELEEGRMVASIEVTESGVINHGWYVC